MSGETLEKTTHSRCLVRLDMVRICSMMFILTFYTNVLYGLLAPFIEQGAIFCSIFYDFGICFILFK